MKLNKGPALLTALKNNKLNRDIVIAIPDLHAPYHHNDALDFLNDTRKEFKPTKIVCLGDEADFHSLSFHDKEPGLYCAGREYDEAKRFLKNLYKLFPKAQCCISNHTARPYRVAHKAGLPSNMILDYRKLFEAPRTWQWAYRIVIDNVVYEHGDPGSGRNAAYKAMLENRMSTVIGHVHGWAGVQYSKSPFNQTFWMNAGCLIDPESLAFAYGNKYRNKATLGCGIIIEGESAYFVRMPQ